MEEPFSPHLNCHLLWDMTFHPRDTPANRLSSCKRLKFESHHNTSTITCLFFTLVLVRRFTPKLSDFLIRITCSVENFHKSGSKGSHCCITYYYEISELNTHEVWNKQDEDQVPVRTEEMNLISSFFQYYVEALCFNLLLIIHQK